MINTSDRNYPRLLHKLWIIQLIEIIRKVSHKLWLTLLIEIVYDSVNMLLFLNDSIKKSIKKYNQSLNI